jgi:inhibitor of cysteine peptidase
MEHTVAETDNNRTIVILPGETVRIVLPENATTGYRWEIDRYDKELIGVVATEPHYTGKAVGSGGQVAFILQGKKPGTGEIMLKQWRSWEGDSSVISRFRLRLDIQP